MPDIRHRSGLCAENEEDEEGEESEEGEEGEEGGGFVVGDYDSKRWEAGQMCCEVAELAARNLLFPYEEDNPDDRCEGRLVWNAVNKIVNDLRFLVPTSSSHKWDPAFVEILSRSHSMRITEVGQGEREEVRKHTGKCVICGTWESSCSMVVELCGACDGDAYDAREWSDIKQWPALFDKLLPAYDAVKLPTWRWPRYELPKEYMGAYTIGSTCIRHLVNAFVAQTLTMELTFGAWSEVVAMGDEDPGYKAAPTVSRKKIKSLLDTLSDLKSCAASDFPRLPAVPSDPSYWSRIDMAVEDVASRTIGAGVCSNPRLLAGGIRARELLKRPCPESSEEGDDDGEQSGTTNESRNTRSRTGKRDHGRNDDSGTDSSGDEFVDDDDGEEDAEEGLPSPRMPASGRKSTRPTRQAATKADAARRHMCCGGPAPSTAASKRVTSAKKRSRRAAVLYDDDEDDEDDGADPGIPPSTGHGASSSRGLLPLAPPPPPPPSPRAPPPRPANMPASVAAPDLGAGRLRAMIDDPSNPNSRMLRGYDTTVTETMELAQFLHAQGHPLHSAAAARTVVVLQDLIEKNRNLRAATQL